MERCSWSAVGGTKSRLVGTACPSILLTDCGHGGACVLSSL